MADLTEMGLRKPTSLGNAPRKPTTTDHNRDDTKMITRTHAKTGKIIGSDVPVCPNYNLDRALVLGCIVEPENNQRQRSPMGTLQSTVVNLSGTPSSY